MVDVEGAVEIAERYLAKVMPRFAALHPEIMEFERSSDGSLWNVTFRAKNPEPREGAANIFYPYIDKLVQIQTSNGELIAIRNPTYN